MPSENSTTVESLNGRIGATRPWTEVTSAAALTLRYLTPLRRQLISMLGSEPEADEALRLLIAHLVKKGFDDRTGDRLRDHLLKTARSAAKVCLRRRDGGGRVSSEGVSSEGESSEGESSEQRRWDAAIAVPSDAPEWIRVWRDGLLERAWRELERAEHAQPSVPVFSVLHTATRMPNETPEMLAVRIASETGMTIDRQRVELTLPPAKEAFARLVTDEVRATLHRPTPQQVRDELQALGLTEALRRLESD